MIPPKHNRSFNNKSQPLRLFWGARFFEIALLLCASIIAFVLVSCLSFSPFDNSPYYFSTHAHSLHNWGGVIGSRVAAFLYFVFGSSIFCLLVASGYALYLAARGFSLWSFKGRLSASVPATLVVSTLLYAFNLDRAEIIPGGVLGSSFFSILTFYVGYSGAGIVLTLLSWIAAFAFFEQSVVAIVVTAATRGREIIMSIVARAKQYCARISVSVQKKNPIADVAPVVHREAIVRKEPQVTPLFEKRGVAVARTLFGRTYNFIRPCITPLLMDECKKQCAKNNETYTSATSLHSSQVEFTLPSLDLFKSKPRNAKQLELLKAECLNRAALLEEKLQHFDVEGKVTAIHPGPVVTLFEYTPAIGTKISKIVSLEDDLAMVLKAKSIRIRAPIPGRSVVGFEISNEQRDEVVLSDIVHSKEFEENEAFLPLALGVDTVGNAVIYDLLSMPHLLVAGSTGSGKSVGLNAMLMSLLCTRRPDEMRLILIDPKRLEFSPYRDIPHLLFPIITEPRVVAPVLKWAVSEMERRYEKMAEAGVRNLFDYRAMAEKNPNQEQFEFIVVVIDELADLMMVAGKEIEILLARLSQMARAAGIHMIIATQRPSVDVLTGIIKVNFPSRISFRVSSKIDSKTILDTSGAEKLLGRGDMLFSTPSSSEIKRIHGAYVSDEEICMLNDYVRTQGKPSYRDIESILHKTPFSHSDYADPEEEDLYAQIVEYVTSVEEISISMLQRKYRIGFNRSARMIERLEMAGLIAPAQGSKPRKVLR